MRRKLIKVDTAAERLCISATAIRQRRCGTEKLTHIRPGGARRILLIEDEVDALIDEWIKAGERVRPDTAVKRYLRKAG